MKAGQIPVRLFAEVIALVALVQAGLVLWVLPRVPRIGSWPAAALAAALLVLLAAPALYWRCMQATHRALRSRDQAPAEAADRPALRGAKNRRRTAIVMTAGAQLLGLALTFVALVAVDDAIGLEAHARFERHVERLEDELLRRFQLPVGGLKGARGLYAARTRVERADFRAFVESRDLKAEFPGVLGFGFIERVPRAALARFVHDERRDGAPPFDVHGSGEAPELYVVKLIEPLAPNHAGWGHDAGAEPLRREAIERAIDTGLPTLSSTLELLETPGRPRGFLYLVPIYAQDGPLATVEQRRQALRGLIYAPILAHELLAGVDRVADGTLDFELFHGDGSDARQMVFDSDGHLEQHDGTVGDAQYGGRLFSTARSLQIGDRTLTMRASTRPAFEASIDRRPVLLVGAVGALLSCLLALTVWALAASRLRALSLAQRMTADLDRLAQVVRHTQNAVTITDPQLRISWVNEGFVRMTGHGLEDAIGRTPGELLGSGKADPAVLARLAESAAAGRSCRAEIPNRRRDGGEYWVDTEIQPLHDEAGRLTGFMEIGSDITDKHAAAEQLADATRQLARQRQRLDNILQGTRAGTWEWNPQTGEVLVNERWAELVGYTLAELQPVTIDTWHRLAHPDDRERSERLQQQHFEGLLDHYECELRMRHRDGHWVWIHARGRIASRTADGRPEWMAGTHLDISARKEAEAGLQQREHLMRLVTDNIPGRIAYWDRGMRLRFANRIYFEQFGIDPAGAIGRSATELLGDARMAIYRERVETVLRGEAVSFERDEVHADGQRRQTLTHYVPDLQHGSVAGFFALTTDIGDIKRAEQAAEAASEAKSRFLANMSHEIRTPLNAILGMLKLLGQTGLTQRQLDYAGKTERAARALLALLNDILDFSKVEAGKLELDPRPFSLDTVLRDLSVILAAELGAKPVEILFDIDPRVPERLVGDDLRLQQILINLGGNAIKFTPSGEVIVGVRLLGREGDRARLEFSVRDTGIGIAPEHQQRIFDGFAQAEASTTRRFGGTGLGLSISRRLVAMMGGTITLASTPERGSRFAFTLDMAVADDNGIAAPPGQALRVLVVDDNPNARDVLSTMAQSLGWSVDTAAGGDDALALLQRRLAAGAGYDAVFVDWQMPGVDGWQTCRRMRALCGSGAPLLLMVTVHDRARLGGQTEADQALLDGYLVKPVTASMLNEAVRDARHDSAGVPVPGSAGPRRLSGLRLLVVEDNPNNRQIAQELLQGEGALVSLAADGAEGVAAVQSAQTPFDAVLMDLQMPVLDGFGATARIRGLGWRTLPIIAMTANVLPGDRDASLEAGLDEHVGKPFDLDQVIQIVLELCRRNAGTPVPVPAPAVPPRRPPPPEALLAQAGAAGIELAAALARLGGRGDVYASLAESFEQRLAGLPGELRALLADTTRGAEAQRLLHTLKGLAATLGVVPLARLAGDGEALLASADPSVHEALLASVAVACTDTRATLAALLPPLAAWAAAARAAAAPGRPVEAPPAERLAMLARLLRDSDMAATETFAALADALGEPWRERLAPLAAAIDALDFEAALTACQALTAEPRRQP